jgi:hypothetical protein
MLDGGEAHRGATVGVCGLGPSRGPVEAVSLNVFVPSLLVSRAASDPAIEMSEAKLVVEADLAWYLGLFSPTQIVAIEMDLSDSDSSCASSWRQPK